MSIVSTVDALRTLASQLPTYPPRAVVDRRLVERRRPGEVPVTWIDPAASRIGTVVHLHGGFYLNGETPRHWAWLEELRRRAGTAAAMIHYRMPPRFPFPAACEDTLAALRGMLQTLDLQPGRWVLSGDSAGAGLALAVTRMLIDADQHAPAMLLLTSPWIDLADAHVDSAEAVRAARLYARDVPVTDPRVSPLLGDVHGLPPVHLTAGGQDVMVGQGRRLAEKILAAGGQIQVLDEPAAGHDFVMHGGPLAQAALRAQIAAVRGALSVRPAL